MDELPGQDKESGAAAAPAPRRRVLVTGAGGNVGSRFAAYCRERYDLTLMAHPDEDTASIESFGSVVRARLEDAGRMEELCRGIDSVVHLAAVANSSAPWEALLASNIVGAYNLMMAAAKAKCRRLVFASSVHAVLGYPPERQVRPEDPVRPGSVYGATKCFGEALAAYLAYREGVSTVVVRIGSVKTPEEVRQGAPLWYMNLFVSYDDLCRLFERCIEAPRVRFALVHALSDNAVKRLDITSARELLGYVPQDDFCAEHPQLEGLGLRAGLHLPPAGEPRAAGGP